MQKKIFKSENGAVTLFVLIAILFFLIVIFGMYVRSSSKNQVQISEMEKVQKEYQKDVDNIDQIYGEVKNKSQITIKEAKKDEILNKTNNTEVTVVDGTVTLPAGFKVAEDSGTTIDEGIVIEDSKQNQFVWVPVSQENFASEFVRREGYYEGKLDSMISDCGEADATGTNDKVTETATTQREAKNMYKSVKANGGFYIGRYEAGKDTNGKVVVQKNANVYNNVYWSSTEAMQESETATTGGAVELSRNFAKENNYKTVQSTLIYGVQWDAVMNWMKNVENSSATSTDKKYIIDSTGMGWYDGVSGNSEHKTGIE